MRKTLFCLIAAWSFMGIARPAEVSAQDNLSSSMTAYCLTANCTSVKFSLNVIGNVLGRSITMNSLDGNLWLFQGLTDVIRSNGTSAGSAWSGTVSNNALTLNGSGYWVPEPVHFIVDMQPGAGAVQGLLNGNITYVAGGDYNGDPNSPNHGTSTPWTTSGTVAPEPSSWIMLATGLLGLAFMRRRGWTEEVQV